MNEKKSLREKFNELSNSKKAQVVIASTLSIFLLIAVPTFAWFSLNSKIETLTKIKAPTTLDIKSGHAYSIEYLDLSDIDATEADQSGYGHKDYVFSVKAGTSISEYDIQIAHTTNIPFTYTLYRAKELGSGSGSSGPAGTVMTFEYYDQDTDATTTYYYGYASNSASVETPVNLSEDAILTLTDLNPDTINNSTYGRILGEKYDGDDDIYSEYSEYTGGDDPQIYAVPLYSQHTNIKMWDPDHDYFILRLSWNTNNDNTAFAEWNSAANNKETDMIYISAKASAGSQ